MIAFDMLSDGLFAAVAAIGNGNQVMNVVIIVLTTMSTAATILLTQHIGAGRTLGGGFKCSAGIAIILGQQRHQPEIRLRLQRRQPLRECRPPHQQTAAIGQRRRGFIQRERAIQRRQFCLYGRFCLLYTSDAADE